MLRSVSPLTQRPLWLVLVWQACAALVLAAIAALCVGKHAAASALLGGMSVVVAGSFYLIMVSGRRIGSAGDTIRTLVRAEAVKIMLIVFQLWLVLTKYHGVIAPIFIGAFVVAIL